MFKKVALLVLLSLSSLHADTPDLFLGNCTEDWLIKYDHHILIGAMSVSMIGIYLLMPLYYELTGTVLEDTDSFKKLALEEFRQVGLSYDNSFQVIVNVAAEGRYMMVIRNCLIVAPSVYEEYQAGEMPMDETRFVLRHEASHLRHNDVTHRVAGYIALNALGSCCIDRVMSPSNIYECIVATLYKQAFIGTLILLMNGTLNYYQEKRADREGAADLTLATGGAHFFERIEGRIDNYVAIERWIYTQPFVFRMLTGYQTIRERVEAMQSIAQEMVG